MSIIGKKPYARIKINKDLGLPLIKHALQSFASTLKTLQAF